VASLERARQKHGALAVAITGNPSSELAELGDKVLDVSIPDFAFAPGVRSYRMSLLALYLLAIRLGEVRDLYSQDEANALREELKGTSDAIEATIEAVKDKTRELAEAVAEEKSFVFVGDGPNYATALFGAAKVIEAAGRHAMGQETEEWAHLQYFTSIDTVTPTFLISPGHRGHDRAAELVAPMSRVGRGIIAVVPEGDEAIAPKAKWVLPVAGDVREAFTPMVYPVASELFAAHLSDVVGEPFFRRANASYDQGNDIRTSAILEAIEV
jgi:glutamine---fructose-6-phosphate transaminase (isomerizing)